MSKPTLLSLAWNQDQGCFACGLSNGFRVFNSDPLKQKQSREFDDGGVGCVEMLFRCNFIALVGGGPVPKAPTSRLLVWDDRKRKCVIDYAFKSELRGVRLRRDRILAVLDTHVDILSFSHSPVLLHSLHTVDNPKGLCALSPHATNATLALPGLEPGHMQIVDLADPRRSPLFVAAHETPLACIAISQDGTRIATASEKGTLIRVFDSATGQRLKEVRRGSDRATIHCINFNADASLICVSSDKCTVHVFSLEEEEKRSGVLPKYFHSQWSFAKFHVSSPHTICAFSASNAVIAVGMDGSWYRFEHGGRDGSKDPPAETRNFLELPEDGGEAEADEEH